MRTILYKVRETLLILSLLLFFGAAFWWPLLYFALGSISVAVICDEIAERMGRKRKQTTFCYCPECKNELISSDSFASDEELVTYKCTKCGCVSKWLFDAPCPILIKNNNSH